MCKLQQKISTKHRQLASFTKEDNCILYAVEKAIYTIHNLKEEKCKKMKLTEHKQTVSSVCHVLFCFKHYIFSSMLSIFELCHHKQLVPC
jgi:hypothetical protein